MSAATRGDGKSPGGRKPRRGWFATARALAGAVLWTNVLLARFSATDAQAGDDRWGWRYCSPPYPPACVETSAKAPGKPSDERLACEKAVQSYVASVFAYRVCLAGETERAVREANRVLQTLKCPEDKRYCYDLPPPASSEAQKPRGK